MKKQKQLRISSHPNLGLYDWYDKKRKILGRYSGKKLVPDIHVSLVSKLDGKSVTQYMVDMYKEGFLTGKAKKEIEELFVIINKSR